jgi:hypothetical protein
MVEEIKENSLQAFAPSRKTRSKTRSRTGKNAGRGVSTVEGEYFEGNKSG